MKRIHTTLLPVILLAFIHSGPVMSWGTDKIVSPTAIAQHSLGAKLNGVLHAAAPIASLTGFMEVAFYTSTDNGETWSLNTNASHPNLSMAPVIRTKIVVTSLDSVICLILQNNTIHLVNLESGVTGQFTQTGAQEFDAATGSGNYIYLYVQEPASNNIRRYGTNTGGLTWTGNTALVTGTGFRPRVTMWGTRLILNYYGPLAPDTVSSVIRAAFYNETAPGTLQAGTFTDVATNTTVKKKEFQSVINNGIVWFFYTEGDLQEVVKCRVSNDNGIIYLPEFIAGGDAQVSARWFAAAPYTLSGTFGVTLTYLTDSINSPVNTFDRMIFATAANNSPSSFTIPQVPFNTYNDTAVVSQLHTGYPVMVNYNFGSVAESGVAWIGESASLPVVYFDRLNALVSIDEIQIVGNNIHLYPIPANETLNIAFTENSIGIDMVRIYDLKGTSVMEINPQEPHSAAIDIRNLPAAHYFLEIASGNQKFVRKFTIAR